MRILFTILIFVTFTFAKNSECKQSNNHDFIVYELTNITESYINDKADSITGWKRYGSGSLSQEFSGGVGYMKLKDIEYDVVSNFIEIPNQELYTQTIVITLRGPVESSGATLYIRTFDSSGNYLHTGTPQYGFPVTDEWKTHEIPVKMAKNVEAIRFVINPKNYVKSRPGNLEIKDIKLLSKADTFRGNWISSLESGKGVFQVPVENKILSGYSLPDTNNTTDSVYIKAAKDEFEPFQLIISPDLKHRNVSLTNIAVSDLVHKSGAQISKDSIIVRAQHYLYMNHADVVAYHTSDKHKWHHAKTGVSTWESNEGYVPDALPLWDKSRDAKLYDNTLFKREFLPLWFTLHVPAHAAAGIYAGSVTFKFSDNTSLEIPLSLEVFNFKLPKQTYLQSLICSWGMNHAYHKVTDIDDKITVTKNYLREFKNHRLNCQRILDGIAGLWMKFEENPAVISNNRFVPIWKGKFLVDADNKILRLSREGHISFHDVKKFHSRVGTEYVLTAQCRGKVGDVATIAIDNMGTVKHRFKSSEWETVKKTLTVTSSRQGAKEAVIDVKISTTSDSTYINSLYLLPVNTASTEKRLMEDFEGALNINDFSINVFSVNPTGFEDLVRFAYDTLQLKNLILSGDNFPVQAYQCNLTIDGYLFNSDFMKAFFAEQVKQILNLYDNALEREAIAGYHYTYDEPGSEYFHTLNQYAEGLDSALGKRIKKLVTKYDDGINGNFDILVPELHAYDRHFWFTDEAWPSHITEKWWYPLSVAFTSSGMQYPNLFMDTPGVNHRSIFWQMFKNDIEGFYYWGYNYWNTYLEGEVRAATLVNENNPWNDPTSASPATTLALFENGDGRLLYPPRDYAVTMQPLPNELPVPSIRWELIREGIEDYDYFCYLEDLMQQLPTTSNLYSDAAKALELYPVILSRYGYSKNPYKYRERRELVARLIEQILSRKNGVTTDDS